MKQSPVSQPVPPFRIADQTDLSPSTDPAVARAHVLEATGEFEAERTALVGAIDSQNDIAQRTCRPGHLTGSAMVVDLEHDAVVLLFHNKLQRWLQPGGHADGETNLARVALDEATEETGIEDLAVITPAVDIDIHRVDPPKEDAHDHLDVRFAMLAPSGAQPVSNHESAEVRWVPRSELANYGLDENTHRLIDAAFHAARQVAGA